MLLFTGEQNHFNINLEDEVVRGSIVTQNVSIGDRQFKGSSHNGSICFFI